MGRFSDVQLFSGCEVVAVQGFGHGKRLSELRRAIRKILDVLFSASFLHLDGALDGLDSSDQYCSRLSHGFGCYVQTIVHSICEVDVCVSRLTEHDLISSSWASVRMASRVVVSSVCLRLNDDPLQPSVSESSHENLAKEFPCHAHRVSFIECPPERPR